MFVSYPKRRIFCCPWTQAKAFSGKTCQESSPADYLPYFALRRVRV
jgi:hypothetical protein